LIGTLASRETRPQSPQRTALRAEHYDSVEQWERLEQSDVKPAGGAEEGGLQKEESALETRVAEGSLSNRFVDISFLVSPDVNCRARVVGRSGREDTSITPKPWLSTLARPSLGLPANAPPPGVFSSQKPAGWEVCGLVDRPLSIQAERRATDENCGSPNDA